MAEPMGIIGSIDDDGFLRFRHITVDHEELMEESLEEEGVLYACPVCIGETVFMPKSETYVLAGSDGAAGEG
jgi:hypothetical protein